MDDDRTDDDAAPAGDGLEAGFEDGFEAGFDEEDEASEDGPDAAGFERPVDRFRRGAVGSVVAAGLLGLADALEGRTKEEVAIVQEAPTPPVREPRRLELLLDPDDPSKSLVFLPDPAPDTPDNSPGSASDDER